MKPLCRAQPSTPTRALNKGSVASIKGTFQSLSSIFRKGKEKKKKKSEREEKKTTKAANGERKIANPSSAKIEK